MNEWPYAAVFAGRDAELDRLGGSVAALDTTGGRTVLVGGEAGIGKTRLVEEFCSRARAAGALVAGGVCTPAEGGGLPYAPIVGVLRDLTRQLGDTAAAAIVAPVRRGLGLLDNDDDCNDDGAPAPGNGSRSPGELGRTRLFETLLGCLTRLSERSRVVVVLEDLHWADSATVEVVDFLARNLGAAPLLLLGTFRSDEIEHDRLLGQMLAELGRHRAVTRLELTGLDHDATAMLMSGILGRRPDWALLDAVHGRSGGNPFFAEELTAARDAATLPAALRNVVMLRVERCSPAARAVVELAAIAGASVDHRLLAATSELDPETLRAALVEAVGLHVLTVDDRSRFSFRHALQRDAVCDALLPTERAHLHQAVAVALDANPELGARGPGYAPVELSEHWWEAGDWSRALHSSLAAGDAMAAILAMPEAHAHYERALQAWDLLPDGDERAAFDHVELLLKTADAAYLTVGAARSTGLVELALAEIDAVTDPRRAAVAFTMLGRYAWVNGDSGDAFDAYARALALLPADPSVELAGVMAERARGFLLIAHDREAEEHSRAAIDTARAVGARAEECHALSTLGACVADRGDIDTGIELIRDALEIAEELGRPDLLDLAYKILTHVLMMAGMLDDAAQVVFDGLARDERLVGVRLNGAGGNSTEALIRRGRWDEADDLLGRMDDRGISSCVFGPQAIRAMLCMRRGQLDAAGDHLDAADEFSAGLATVQVRGWFHMLRAELALERGEPADAYEEIEYALMVAAGTDDTTYRPEMCALGIRALADEQDTARARGRRIDTDKFGRLAAALVEQAERNVVTDRATGAIWPPRSAALVAMSAAEESRLGEPDPDRWHRAAHRWDEAGEPYPAAYCRWREAEATLATGGARRRAGVAAQSAWETCVAIGAPPLRQRIERLAQRARITLVADDPDSGDGTDSSRRSVAADLGLTPREVEVLALLALGRTDRQVGEELYIAKKTVSVHVSNILRKLDATNRVEAAEIGQRAGLN